MKNQVYNNHFLIIIFIVIVVIVVIVVVVVLIIRKTSGWRECWQRSANHNRQKSYAIRGEFE